MSSRAALLIAFHYPPCAASSGLQRTLSYSIHLPKYGWRPAVLTANAGAHVRTSTHQLQDIPAHATVARSLAIDATRQLAVKGRYWSRLALPDAWRTWWLTAVPRGLEIIRRHDIQVIWSTYPIASAHSIAATLARITGLPWVADFRDPMVEEIPQTGEMFPKDPALRRARLKVEARTMKAAARAVFCTDGALAIARSRYPDFHPQRLRVIPNGYEEQAFADAEQLVGAREPTVCRRVLLHSGTIYRGPDRDPHALFKALKRLAASGAIAANDVELRLRDPSNPEYFRQLAIDAGVSDFVTIMPALPYREALAEMLAADGLVLLQGETSNPAIPAKLYEYLRAKRPLIPLVHPQGQTAATLRKLGVHDMAPLTDVDAIEALLQRWIGDPDAFLDALPPADSVAKYSRGGLTEQLAALFDEAADEGASQPRR